MEDAVEIILSHRATATAAAAAEQQGAAAAAAAAAAASAAAASAALPSAVLANAAAAAAAAAASGNPATAAASDHLLPDLDVFNLAAAAAAANSSPSNSAAGKRKSSVAAAVEQEAVDPAEPPEDAEDNAPLFYSPGKRGFYSPIQGRATPERLNAFRNVGRLMGLCLLQNELCPLFLNRHVIKVLKLFSYEVTILCLFIFLQFMLGRKCRFHDLAFFDPVIFESLRQLVIDAENKVRTRPFQECFIFDASIVIGLTYHLRLEKEKILRYADI